MKFDKISVIGLGYIGLPTAAMFANSGKIVLGVDVNKTVVKSINDGLTHILEPGLEKLVRDAIKVKKFSAKTIPESSDAFLIAVPTPFKETKSLNPEPDLAYIKLAVESISKVLEQGNIVILESTSPVGTTEKISNWLSELRPDLKFPKKNSDRCDVNIAYCPERVLPGNIIKELVDNDRIIGGITEECAQNASDLYKTFVKGKCFKTNSRTAEMAKLTENSSRDVQIAFANELSIICEKLNIDVWELIDLTNRHPRVNILQPGPGVGGHCIAVDPWFIVSDNPKESKIIKTARLVNDEKPKWVINKVKEYVSLFRELNKDAKSDTVSVACYGLAFKADIDDLRESPALEIAKEIQELKQVKVYAVEPNVKKLNEKNIQLVTFEFAQKNANIHLLLVDHQQFKKDIEIDNKFIIDTKGIWKTKI